MIAFPEETSLPSSAAATHWVPSPDSRSIAMVIADASGKGAIWVRSLGDLTTHRLDKTEAAEFPSVPKQLNVILNWNDELQRVLPASGK